MANSPYSENLKYGEIVQLTDRLSRITAPNPGPMTDAGTNTYIVGHNEVAIIDPGPLEQSHVDAILDLVGDRIRWIVATHTHPDHSPAVAPIAKATGAQVVGMLAEDTMFQDETFEPNWHIKHDELITNSEFTLRAIHTPGHVSNHLCFLLEEEGILMAGDHIMNGSTVVIVPPGGDMKDYIESLELLEQYPLKQIAPAHGELMDNPMETLRWLVEHRLGREKKVVEQLVNHANMALVDLVAHVYADVDVSLHGMAKLSLLAHLLKLQQEGRAASNGDGDQQQWVMC